MAEYEELLLDALVDNTQGIHRSLTKLKSSSMEINFLLRKILDLLPNPNHPCDEPKTVVSQVFDETPERVDIVTTEISPLEETESVKETKVFDEMAESMENITTKILDGGFGTVSSTKWSLIFKDKDDLEGKEVVLGANKVFDKMLKITSGDTLMFGGSDETELIDNEYKAIESQDVLLNELIGGYVISIKSHFSNKGHYRNQVRSKFFEMIGEHGTCSMKRFNGVQSSSNQLATRNVYYCDSVDEHILPLALIGFDPGGRYGCFSDFTLINSNTLRFSFDNYAMIVDLAEFMGVPMRLEREIMDSMLPISWVTRPTHGFDECKSFDPGIVGQLFDENRQSTKDIVDQGYTTIGYMEMQSVVIEGGCCAELRDDLEKITKVGYCYRAFAFECTFNFSNASIGVLDMSNDNNTIEQFQVQMAFDENLKFFDIDVLLESIISLIDNGVPTEHFVFCVMYVVRFSFTFPHIQKNLGSIFGDDYLYKTRKEVRIGLLILYKVIPMIEDEHGNIRLFITINMGKFALEVVFRLLDMFCRYFSMPYALPKLDMVVVHEFFARSLENDGLIVYRENGLLHNNLHSIAAKKKRLKTVIAHEVAFQWFVNLVKMEWWTHFWVNEGFATWISHMATDILLLKWNIWPKFLQETNGGLHLDANEKSNLITMDIQHAHEADKAFDAIGYQKGSAVIQMLHEYIGDEYIVYFASYSKGSLPLIISSLQP